MNSETEEQEKQEPEQLDLFEGWDLPTCRQPFDDETCESCQ